MGVQMDSNDSDKRPELPEAKEDRRVIEAEIVDSADSQEGWKGQGNYTTGQARGRTYMGRTLTFAPIDNTGCLAALVTVTVFMACLFQWGLLAGIGFLFFHTIGSIFSSLHTARQLVRGLPYNIWSLRICNWIISFFITAWLAGGFD